MSTAEDTGARAFLHAKDRDITEDEWEELSEQMGQAYRRGDMKEVLRIGSMIPVDANVAMAIKKVYGKNALLHKSIDLTMANLKWGEGWLDEPND